MILPILLISFQIPAILILIILKHVIFLTWLDLVGGTGRLFVQVFGHGVLHFKVVLKPALCVLVEGRVIVAWLLGLLVCVGFCCVVSCEVGVLVTAGLGKLVRVGVWGGWEVVCVEVTGDVFLAWWKAFQLGQQGLWGFSVLEVYVLVPAWGLISCQSKTLGFAIEPASISSILLSATVVALILSGSTSNSDAHGIRINDISLLWIFIVVDLLLVCRHFLCQCEDLALLVRFSCLDAGLDLRLDWNLSWDDLIDDLVLVSLRR